MDNREVWYRYYDHCGSVYKQELPVIKCTPAGVRVDDGSPKGKFIATQWWKRYACPTDAEARESFLARKRRQLDILTRQRQGIENILNSKDPFTHIEPAEFDFVEVFDFEVSH